MVSLLKKFNEKFDIISFIIVIFICATVVWAADTKMTGLTADTSPTSDDLIETVNDPAGTPANRKVTLANLLAAGNSGINAGTDVTADLEEETHASEHNEGGADYIDRLTEGITEVETTAADTTPDVTNGTALVTRLWESNGNGTITDFDDGDDHSEFVAGDWFIFRITDATTVIDFSDNANIEGNANTNFTGSATQLVDLLFMWDGTRWQCLNLFTGMSDPTTLAIDSIGGFGNNYMTKSNGSGELVDSAITNDGSEINAQALQFVTTGDIMGGINISGQSSGAYTVGTSDAHEAYGTLFINTDNDAENLTLPATLAAGMSGCFANGQGVTAALTLTPQSGDYLVLDGVRGTIATAISSTGAAGDKICWVVYDGTDVYITSYTGSWSE